MRTKFFSHLIDSSHSAPYTFYCDRSYCVQYSAELDPLQLIEYLDAI